MSAPSFYTQSSTTASDVEIIQAESQQESAKDSKSVNAKSRNGA